MTGFEQQISGVGSNHSTYCVATSAHRYEMLCLAIEHEPT